VYAGVRGVWALKLLTGASLVLLTVALFVLTMRTVRVLFNGRLLAN
jgi:tellurite resistance protein